jgi:dihydropteroate synthase
MADGGWLMLNPNSLSSATVDRSHLLPLLSAILCMSSALLPLPSALPRQPPAAVMAILNCTPDSFSDGGRLMEVTSAVVAGVQAVADGAMWLDVGGESSRPGAVTISIAEECARVVPVIRGLRHAGLQVPISIDTTKAAVAEAALAAGATAINDVSAGADPAMLPLAAATGCGLILMHRQGTAATMQVAPAYADVVAEVTAAMAERLAAAMAAGVAREHLWADPGIGFGKTVAHNLALLRSLPHLQQAWQVPLVVGISRKRVLAAIGGTSYPAPDALGHVLHAMLAPACALLRVHDVPGTMASLAAAGIDRQRP